MILHFCDTRNCIILINLHWRSSKISNKNKKVFSVICGYSTFFLVLLLNSWQATRGTGKSSFCGQRELFKQLISLITFFRNKKFINLFTLFFQILIIFAKILKKIYFFKNVTQKIFIYRNDFISINFIK